MCMPWKSTILPFIPFLYRSSCCHGCGLCKVTIYPCPKIVQELTKPPQSPKIPLPLAMVADQRRVVQYTRSIMGHQTGNGIPANFFWDISARFLSWECWDFWRRHDHFWRFPKKSKVFQRSPTSSEDVQSINASSLPVLFSSKIRDREEGIVIYSFYTWFSFLTWVWVNIFLEIVSSKTATTHIFQSGVRNWSASVSQREIEVFNL